MDSKKEEKKSPIPIRFPGDRDKGNARLTQHLFEQLRDQLDEGYPQTPELRQAVVDITRKVIDENWVVVEDKNPANAFTISKWVAAVFACTIEKRAVIASYNKIVDEARKGSEFPALCQRAPFLILQYPEMVKQADWMLGRMLDILVDKKNLLIFTEDRMLLEDALGPAITNMISAKTNGTHVQ